jgi:hypothetical protein
VGADRPPRSTGAPRPDACSPTEPRHELTRTHSSPTPGSSLDRGHAAARRRRRHHRMRPEGSRMSATIQDPPAQRARPHPRPLRLRRLLGLAVPQLRPAAVVRPRRRRRNRQRPGRHPRLAAGQPPTADPGAGRRPPGHPHLAGRRRGGHRPRPVRCRHPATPARALIAPPTPPGRSHAPHQTRANAGRTEQPTEPAPGQFADWASPGRVRAAGCADDAGQGLADPVGGPVRIGWPVSSQAIHTLVMAQCSLLGDRLSLARSVRTEVTISSPTRESNRRPIGPPATR